MLAEKELQLELSAPHSVSIPEREAQGVTRTLLLGRADIFGHEEKDGLQDSRWAGCPCGEGGERREEKKKQLHTCLEGKTIVEIGDFLEWFGGDNQEGSCGFSGRGFDTRG